jgi:sugar phosphate isomerase/epimerase
LQQAYRSKLEIVLGGTARNPEDVLALYDLGLAFAEISTKNLKDFNHNITNFIELVENTGLYYLCHGPNEGDPNSMNSISNDYLSHVENILEIMPMLKMSLLTLHLWLDRRFVRSHVIDFKIGLLRKIVDKATEKNIIVCLENLSEDWEDLDAVFRELPLLHLTLDVGHAQLLRKETTAFGLIAAYPDRIKHIHIHDNLGGNSPKDDLHLPPGEGIVDFRGIFDALRGIGYTGTATFELRPQEIKSCLPFIKKFLG